MFYSFLNQISQVKILVNVYKKINKTNIFLFCINTTKKVFRTHNSISTCSSLSLENLL